MSNDALALEGRAPKKAPPPEPPPAWVSRVTTVPADWYVTPPARRTYLLRDSRRDTATGYLPLGRVGQVIAEGGAGKTMAAAFQLAVAVATGTPWLGTFNVATAARALILAGEEDNDESQRRLYRTRRAAGAPIPPDGSIVVHALTGMTCGMVDRDAAGNWVDSPYLTQLRTWIAEHGPWGLVVVDPLSRFAGPDAETDNAAATRFTVALESLAPGATTLSLHHTNKLSRNVNGEITASAGRGASGLVDGARWQAAMGVERLNFEDRDVRERLGEIVVLAHTKSNYSRKAAPLLLRRDNDNGGALLPLDADDLEMVAASRAGAEPRRARTAEREADRARTLSERERKDAELRAAKLSGREAERRQRDDDDDQAVAAILEGEPTIKIRELRAVVRARRACGGDRADAAIRRVRRGDP